MEIIDMKTCFLQVNDKLNIFSTIFLFVTSASPKNNNKRSNAIIKCTTFLGHPEIIASLFHELEVDKLIDEKFPKSRDHKVPHANCILSMVLNGPGFVGQPLYLCPDYFKNVSVGRLFGKGI